MSGKPKIMSGQRFGDWVVKERSKHTDAKRRAYWVCECECGNIGIVRGDNLRRGTSLGCKQCMWGRVN